MPFGSSIRLFLHPSSIGGNSVRIMLFDSSQVYKASSQPSTETPLLWTQVVNSKRKGNNKKQQSIVSFNNSTLTNRPVTDTEASQQTIIINGEASSRDPNAVIQPLLKGIEQEDSLFTDLTPPVKDQNLLNRLYYYYYSSSSTKLSLIITDTYEDFLSYRCKPRYFLGHAFLQTRIWLLNGKCRQTHINEAATLEDDGTFVKAFPSYPADATIVKRTIENLPFFLPALL